MAVSLKKSDDIVSPKMNRLTACIIALFMLAVGAVYIAVLVTQMHGWSKVPVFGAFIMSPAIALIVGALFILERVTRHRPKMRPKY